MGLDKGCRRAGRPRKTRKWRTPAEAQQGRLMKAQGESLRRTAAGVRPAMGTIGDATAVPHANAFPSRSKTRCSTAGGSAPRQRHASRSCSLTAGTIRRAGTEHSASNPRHLRKERSNTASNRQWRTARGTGGLPPFRRTFAAWRDERIRDAAISAVTGHHESSSRTRRQLFQRGPP